MKGKAEDPDRSACLTGQAWHLAIVGVVACPVKSGFRASKNGKAGHPRKPHSWHRKGPLGLWLPKKRVKSAALWPHVCYNYG